MPGERVKNIPESTTKVPLKSWIKGRLTEESELYEEATILTATKRKVVGTVKEVNPAYKHTFGEFVPEILKMREKILEEMWGDTDE